MTRRSSTSRRRRFSCLASSRLAWMDGRPLAGRRVMTRRTLALVAVLAAGRLAPPAAYRGT